MKTMAKIKEYDTDHGGANIARRISFSDQVKLEARSSKTRLRVTNDQRTKIADWYCRWLEKGLWEADATEPTVVRAGEASKRELFFIPKGLYTKAQRWMKAANKQLVKGEEPLNMEDTICTLVTAGMRSYVEPTEGKLITD